MIGLGSSTVYKMVVNEDGSPNWLGISILTTISVVVFCWRCVVIVPEYWVAVRKRMGRVVRDKDGMPKEYDPLGPLDGDEETNRKSRSIQLRFYMVNSLELVNCGDRETPLDIGKLTFGGIEFDTSFTAAWAISRRPGAPTKSILKPGTDNRKKKDKDQLEDLIRTKVSNAVLRAFELREQNLVGVPKALPTLSIKEDEALHDVAEFLLCDYGVDLQEVLYGQRSVAAQRRDLEGRLAIASSNEKVAVAHHAVADAIRTKADHGLPDFPPAENDGSVLAFGRQ